ncbi:MAG: hypothetical protein NWS46_02350, partial [Cyclobacteriaceae bacterium]|nr:hypothetical protein [Cyclobacteriaceae bacterium]
MKIYFLLILFCVSFRLTSYGQSDGNYEYSKEFTWGINKNTNAGLLGGFTFKWANAITEKRFRTFGFELMNVKHPKEIRVSTSGSPYLYPKRNYLYTVRGFYGRDFLLFKKAPQQGVQIIFTTAAGPTIGVVAPYYVRTDQGSAQFDYTKMSQGSILGTGHIFQGLGESDLKIGVNAKAGLIFELGAFKSNVTGFEVGAQFEAFSEKIIIVPTQPNRAIYSS